MPDVTHRLIGDADQDYKIHITPRSRDWLNGHVTMGIIYLGWGYFRSNFMAFLHEKFITVLIRSLQDWHGDENITLD